MASTRWDFATQAVGTRPPHLTLTAATRLGLPAFKSCSSPSVTKSTLQGGAGGRASEHVQAQQGCCAGRPAASALRHRRVIYPSASSLPHPNAERPMTSSVMRPSRACTSSSAGAAGSAGAAALPLAAATPCSTGGWPPPPLPPVSAAACCSPLPGWGAPSASRLLPSAPGADISCSRSRKRPTARHGSEWWGRSKREQCGGCSFGQRNCSRVPGCTHQRQPHYKPVPPQALKWWQA